MNTNEDNNFIMASVLKKINLGDLCTKFEIEKITPDIAGHLSLLELKALGVTDSRNMMALRMQCSKNRSDWRPRKILQKVGELARKPLGSRFYD